MTRHLLPIAFCIALSAGLFSPLSRGADTAKDYSGQDLHGQNFKDANLNGANFEGANLSGANLSNATLKGANFKNANLQHAILSSAMMDDADFTGADTTAADWIDAHAWHATLTGIKIDLVGAVVLDLKKLNLDYASEKLIMANRRSDDGTLTFHYADMRGCKFAGTAVNVDFRGADLRGADFSKATDVDKARFGDAKYDSTTIWNIDPVKMHAVLVAPTPAGGSWLGQIKTAAPKISHHPLIGDWLILKGEKGATESGSLQIHADGNFDWDYSANAKPVSGKWDEAGDDLHIKAGENGENWTVKKTGADEITLTSDKGTQRLAVLNK